MLSRCTVVTSFFLLLLTTAACAPLFNGRVSAAQSRFAHEYSCQPEITQGLAGGAINVTGCGWDVIYVCEAQRLQTICVKDSEQYEGPENRMSASAPASQPATVEMLPTRGDGRAQHKKSSILGKGYTEYDRFKKTRTFGWRDVIVTTEGGKRLLYIDFVVTTEDGGKPLARDAMNAVLRFRTQPAGPRYEKCYSLDFLADDMPVAVDNSTYREQEVLALLPLADLQSLAAATKLEGRLCSDEFSFTTRQSRELRRFWNGLKSQIEKAEENRPIEYTQLSR